MNVIDKHEAFLHVCRSKNKHGIYIRNDEFDFNYGIPPKSSPSWELFCTLINQEITDQDLGRDIITSILNNYLLMFDTDQEIKILSKILMLPEFSGDSEVWFIIFDPSQEDPVSCR